MLVDSGYTAPTLLLMADPQENIFERDAGDREKLTALRKEIKMWLRPLARRYEANFVWNKCVVVYRLYKSIIQQV